MRMLICALMLFYLVICSSVISESSYPRTWTAMPSWAPSPQPVSNPAYQGYASNPQGKLSEDHTRMHPASSPFSSPLSSSSGCNQLTCEEPRTPTPIGSPCGCVFPMHVKLSFGAPLVVFFPQIQELLVEAAAGTYLKQSQVRIVNATISKGRTVVDIYLIPLGEKFDNTTVSLIYNRLRKKEVKLNVSLFGDYKLVFIHYAEFPFLGGGYPFPPAKADVYPITANLGDKSHKMNTATVTIISICASLFTLICMGTLLILFRLKKHGRTADAVGPAVTSSLGKGCGVKSIASSRDVNSTLSSLSTLGAHALSLRTFSLAELEKATDNFNFRRILGEGGFGRVYRGTMEDGFEVAVKLLVREHQQGDLEFISEIEMLSRLHHRNLVKLMGICIEDCARCLIYELIRNGSVESHLHGASNRKGHLDWDARMKIALGAARGLAYLHEDSNPRVIHRDFKASNILLEDDFTPKISDFGLAREALDGSHYISTRVMGTFGYVAPEYAMTGHLLVKSDVYSYGVVLLELLSGRKPVDMSQPEGQENLVTWSRSLLASKEGLDEFVDPSLGGNYNFDNMARVAAIASMCVHSEVSHRPFMGEVVQALKLICNDANESFQDSYSLREESSVPDSDIRYDMGHDGSGWWASGMHLAHGLSITMDYSSGPLERNNRPLSMPTSFQSGRFLTAQNSSGPLRSVPMNPVIYRLMTSRSEDDRPLQCSRSDRYWT